MALFCFNFAGGSARDFAAWSEAAAELVGVAVFAVELPGRGIRAEEPQTTNDETDDAELSAITSEIEACVANIDLDGSRPRVILCGRARRLEKCCTPTIKIS